MRLTHSDWKLDFAGLNDAGQPDYFATLRIGQDLRKSVAVYPSCRTNPEPRSVRQSQPWPTFIDLTSRTTHELTAAIDDICRQIPGFFFGRLDIRFKSWDDLEAGKSFSII